MARKGETLLLATNVVERWNRLVKKTNLSYTFFEGKTKWIIEREVQKSAEKNYRRFRIQGPHRT